MKKKIILFDVDGTLVNAGGSGIIALNKAIEEMKGKKDICNCFNLQGSTDKENLSLAFKEAFKKEIKQKEFLKLKNLYLKFLPEAVKDSVKKKRYFKIKGIEKFLEFLSKQENVLLGLGTGNFKEGAYLKLKPSGLDKYFSFGGFGEDFKERYKMLEQGIKEAEKKIKEKISSDQVYIIGDTEKDVESAKYWSFHSAFVLDGFGKEEKLRSNAPELIEKNFLDLKPWLIWLGIVKDPKGVKKGTYVCPDTPIEHAYYGMTGNGSFLNQKDFKKMEKMIKYAKIKK